MSKYIKPPRSEDCIWRKGPPPSIGWWPASCARNPDMLRWWDGKRWSCYCTSSRTSEQAGAVAKLAWGSPRKLSIAWTDKWWEKK